MYKKKTTTQKFNADLEYGQYFEWETIPFIENLFNKVLNPQGKKLEFSNENLSKSLAGLKEWDMKYALMDTQSNKILKYITFEIKTDRFDCTGNIIFEKTCSKKLSGVFATKADYFIYFLPRYRKDNFYISKPKAIIDLILEKFPQYIRGNVGDGGKVVSYLITKDDFDEEYKAKSSCKLLTCDLEIPEKFNINKFEEKKVTTYYGDSVDTKSDPFKF